MNRSAPAVEFSLRSVTGEGLGPTVAPDGRSVVVHDWQKKTDSEIDTDSGSVAELPFSSDEGVLFQRRAP